VDLRLLTTFRAIVDTGAFGRAADHLGIGASTVTLHVQQLEGELGGPVFVRHGRRLVLSELGESVLRHADAIAGHIDALASEAAEVGGAGRGTLRCGAVAPTAHLDVAPLLATLVGDRPAVRVQLDVAGTEALAKAVANGHLPFAVCSAPPAGLGLRFEPLFREPIVAVMATSSRLGRACASCDGPVTGDDLDGEPVIVSEAGCAYRAHVEDAFIAAGLTLEARAEVGTTAAAVAAVSAGLGVALVPGAGLTALPAGTIARPVADPDLALPLGLVRPRTGEAHSRLTSEACAAIRSAAPRWRP
jgi:DNA-binding transcriptional LysR family regulator